MSSNIADDPPPFLEEGTEVSAKFKGAFCEAKIKKVDRNVKCKLTIKSSNESLTVNDFQVLSSNGQVLSLNELKQGHLVYVNKSGLENQLSTSANNLQAAILNKIIDQSVYTVVFNDDDEKCLKRSFIRFKGEKHYLDSETLNNAPLNNPEHFLYPIKSSKQSPGSKTNNNTSANNLAQSNSESESDLESVSNTTCTTLSLNKKESKEKSGKHFLNSTKQFEEEEEEEDDDENEEENENEDVDEEEDEVAGDENQEDSSSSTSSDDYPPEEKDRFVAQLFKFMDDRGTPMNGVPSVNKVDLDLHKFFIVVRKFGGYNKVNKNRYWLDVYKRLGFPNVNAANVINLKCAYKRYLHPYEDFYRKLGSTMCDLVSLRQTSSSSSSKRSLGSESSNRLFKTRYLNSSSLNQKKPLSKCKQKQLGLSSGSTSVDSKENTVTMDTSLNNEIKSSLSASQLTNTETGSDRAEKKIKRSLSSTESADETLGQEKEFTIESIAFSYNNNTNNASIASSNASNEDQSQREMQEELTLSGMVRNLNENYKKAKKQEKEKKSEESECKKTNFIKTENVLNKDSECKNSKYLNTNSLKRPSSASIISTCKSKARRSSMDKLVTSQQCKKIKNEIYSDEEDQEQDQDEPKRKKKANNNRLSLDLSEDSNSASTQRTSKRKSSLSLSIRDESENEKDKSLKNNLSEDQGKKYYTSNDIEVNKIVEVKYGIGKTTYHAKIVQINEENQTMLVHYLGWNNRYDEWIKIDRIIKIFSDDYGAYKRRKTSSKSTINYTTQRQSSNEAQSPTQSHQSSTDVFLPSTSKEKSCKNSASNESNKNSSQKAKRSSLSSTSSSTSSSNPDPQPPQQHQTSTIKKEQDLIPINSQTKLTDIKNSIKIRSSDSISSNSSADLPILNMSLSSSSSATSGLSSAITTIPIQEQEKLKQEIKEDEKELKQSLELANTQEKMIVQEDETIQGPLLSIKEEILDFEANLEQDKKKETSLETINLVNSIVQDLVETFLTNLNEQDKSDQPEIPDTIIEQNIQIRIVEKKKNSKEKTPSKKETPKCIEEIENIKQTDLAPEEITNKEPANEFKETKIDCEESKENSQLGSSNDSKLVELVKTCKVLNESCLSTCLTNTSSQNEHKEKEKECLTILTNIPKQQISQVPEYKYPFHLIEEQMRLCREEYAKLKNEIAAIDRKKKKLKRNLFEKSSSNSNNQNTMADVDNLSSSSSNKFESHRKNQN